MHCFLSLVQAMGAPLKTDDCLLNDVIAARLLSNVHHLTPGCEMLHRADS